MQRGMMNTRTFARLFGNVILKSISPPPRWWFFANARGREPAGGRVRRSVGELRNQCSSIVNTDGAAAAAAGGGLPRQKGDERRTGVFYICVRAKKKKNGGGEEKKNRPNRYCVHVRLGGVRRRRRPQVLSSFSRARLHTYTAASLWPGPFPTAAFKRYELPLRRSIAFRWGFRFISIRFLFILGFRANLRNHPRNTVGTVATPLTGV